MKEILQLLRASSPEIAEALPRPPRPGYIVVRTLASVVSAGTERMLVEFAQAGMLGKARQQPERVKQMADKVRTDGFAATMEAVRSRLDEPIALGYANAGRVVAVGDGVTHFNIGDLVASNGHHAELVTVPITLCALIPGSIPADQAAYASLGAVALQGIRLAKPTLGERFVVTGLGLIGLLAVQLLRAHGCEVLGIDVNPARLQMASHFGAETVLASGDPIDAAAHFSRGRGVDGVILTAATKSSGPVHDAATMCRRRGRVILVGVTGLELQRADFYEKEISFQVSCSYGPGRYDPSYEASAVDYPIGYVRWTAGRNFEAVLDMIASRRIDVDSLTSHHFPFNEAEAAYGALTEDPSALGIVLDYPSEPVPGPEPLLTRSLTVTSGALRRPTTGRVGVIGAGNFATNTMLPALKKAGVNVAAIVGGGTPGSWAARRFGIGRITNDVSSVIDDPDIDTLFVLTRHDSHADLVARSLAAGKHVFVEKPLAIDAAGLELVIAAREKLVAESGTAPVVGIGFNRRFSAITCKMLGLLDSSPVPRVVSITVNAGSLPAEHWTQDPLVGGGRIVGEGCHFIDLARHLAGSRITQVHTAVLERPGPVDSAVVTLTHDNGSISTVAYLSNGPKQFPKEQVTVFAGGRVLVNQNFRVLRGYGWPKFRTVRLARQDKGHAAGVSAFLDAIAGGNPYPIPFEELVEVTAATLLAGQRH